MKRGLAGVVVGAVGVSRLARMLRNPFYAGEIVLRRTGEQFHGVHTPLVSPELFRRVLDVFDCPLRPSSVRHDYRLRGLFACT